MRGTTSLTRRVARSNVRGSYEMALMKWHGNNYLAPAEARTAGVEVAGAPADE
jgi:hypothetical protein